MPARSISPTPGAHSQHGHRRGSHVRLSLNADGPVMGSFAAPLNKSDSDFDFSLHATNPAIVDLVAADPDWALLELPCEEIDVPEKHRPQTDDADSGPATDRRRAPDDHWHDLDISGLTVELAGNQDYDGDKRNVE
ncbi:hypothetical protein HDU88_001985 [Geranomyces variabilis]|nr:hypothetical protein HDU88_001985 [Geranomyces variabilis]